MGGATGGGLEPPGAIGALTGTDALAACDVMLGGGGLAGGWGLA